MSFTGIADIASKDNPSWNACTRLIASLAKVIKASSTGPVFAETSQKGTFRDAASSAPSANVTFWRKTYKLVIANSKIGWQNIQKRPKFNVTLSSVLSHLFPISITLARAWAFCGTKHIRRVKTKWHNLQTILGKWSSNPNFLFVLLVLLVSSSCERIKTSVYLLCRRRSGFRLHRENMKKWCHGTFPLQQYPKSIINCQRFQKHIT